MSNVINLAKGQVINLSKMSSIDLSKGGNGLHKVMIGLGWDSIKDINSISKQKKGSFFKSLFTSMSELVSTSDYDIDCDAFAIQLRNGVLKEKYLDTDFIYYGNRGESDDAIYHTGDNLTGGSSGDDEQIMIDLDKVCGEIVKIGVTIFCAQERHQHFGMLQNAYIRIVDLETNVELCRFNLEKDNNKEVSLWFGELIKLNNEWSFTALETIAKGQSIGDAIDEFRDIDSCRGWE